MAAAAGAALSIYPIDLAGTTYTLEKLAKLAGGEYGRETLQAVLERHDGAELSQAPAALKTHFPPQPAAVGSAAQRAQAKKQFDALTLERFLTNVMAHPEVIAKIKDLKQGRGGAAGGGNEDALLTAITASNSSKGAHLKGHAALVQELGAEMARGGGHGGMKTDNNQELSVILAGAAPISSDPAKAQSIHLPNFATSVEARALILFTLVVTDTGLDSMKAGSLAAMGFKEKSELAPPSWSLSDVAYPLQAVVFGVTAQISAAAERSLQRSFFSGVTHLKPASAARLVELAKKIPGYITGFLRRVERLSPVGDLTPGIIIFFKHLFEENTLLVIDSADTSNDGALGAQITALHLQLAKEEQTRANAAFQKSLLSTLSASEGGGGGGGRSSKRIAEQRHGDQQGSKKPDNTAGGKHPQFIKDLLARWAKLPPKCPYWATKENWDKPRGEEGADPCIICPPKRGGFRPKCDGKRKCPNVGVMDGGSGKDEIWIHHPQKRYLVEHTVAIPDAGKSPKDANGGFKGYVQQQPHPLDGRVTTSQ